MLTQSIAAGGLRRLIRRRRDARRGQGRCGTCEVRPPVHGHASAQRRARRCDSSDPDRIDQPDRHAPASMPSQINRPAVPGRERSRGIPRIAAIMDHHIAGPTATQHRASAVRACGGSPGAVKPAHRRLVARVRDGPIAAGTAGQRDGGTVRTRLADAARMQFGCAAPYLASTWSSHRQRTAHGIAQSIEQRDVARIGDPGAPWRWPATAAGPTVPPGPYSRPGCNVEMPAQAHRGVWPTLAVEPQAALASRSAGDAPGVATRSTARTHCVQAKCLAFRADPKYAAPRLGPDADRSGPRSSLKSESGKSSACLESQRIPRHARKF